MTSMHRMSGESAWRCGLEGDGRSQEVLQIMLGRLDFIPKGMGPLKHVKQVGACYRKASEISTPMVALRTNPCGCLEQQFMRHT